jgi:CelD/BcsL family acetyltransferase involved in cellulose biosynthesis
LSQVTLETVATLEGIAALRADYEHLHGVTGNVLPFALHEWHLTWCRHFLDCDPYIHDEPLFYILRDTARNCVAIVPFILSQRRLGPLKIVSLGLLGADPAITEIRAPMIKRGYEHMMTAAVRAALAQVRGWDWIHWTGVNGDLAEAMTAGTPLEWQPPLADFVLDLPPTWEEFRAGLKRNIRESLRHCYNSLKRDGHRFELVVIEDPAGLRQGLDQYLALHKMRAGLTDTAIHVDRFASQICRDFLYEVCERLAARGVVRLFAMKIGPRIVAMRLGFAVGDSLYLYYSGFDPEWARYSVMTTTVAEAIKYAIAHGLKTVHLSPTPDISKTRWGPRQVDYGSAYEPNDRFRSRLAHRAYLTARSDSGIQSKILQRLNAARRLWS